MNTIEQEKIKTKEQPWRDDKRAWIFYLDKINNDENTVHGETEECIFLLDCETARLSIWSKRWEVFTDVGISNLLKRMSSTWNENSKEVLGGTRVFYKGIELQDKCLADDTELLEFIDIKGGLDRSYININRNGFTEAGERFFGETLYPGLMEVIQKVLKDLEKKADETKFGTKIYDVVKELCGEIAKEEQTDTQEEEGKVRKREKLISLVGSVAVLAYLAMRDEWNVWENLGGGYPRNGAWEKLVKDIDDLLSQPDYRDLLDELGKMTSLFGIKVYDEDYKEDIERGERNQIEKSVNFLKIFLMEKHWAVLQCRRNRYSPWVSHLIRMKGEKEIFSKLTVIPRSEEDEKELELWGKRLCDITFNERYEDFFTMRNYKHQMLLEWMLKNIPTIGLFCNEQGNIRLNVLAGRIYPSIYMDKNFKCLILERMIEKACEDDIQRFSTITWQGREYISCDRLPFAVYFVRRGYLSDYSYHKCIVPLEGDVLKEWQHVLTEIKASEIARKVTALLNDMDIVTYLRELQQDKQRTEDKEIGEYLGTSPTNAALEIASEVWDRIFAEICSHNFDKQVSIEELLKDEKGRREKWRKIYDMVAKIYVSDINDELDKETVSLEREIYNGDGLNLLCDAWLYCCIFTEEIVGQRSEVRKTYEEYVKKQEKKEKQKKENTKSMDKDDKIVNYIMYKKGPQFSQEALKAGVAEYREELIGLAQELETRQIRQYLEDNMRNYRMFTRQLQREYQKVNAKLSEKRERSILSS